MKYKIAISLLALNNINNIERFFKLLNQNNIKYIELPISKIFKNYEFNKNKLLKFKNLLNKYDLKVSSIQSIFFGRTELNIFNTSQNKLIIEHLIKVLKISKFLGAKNLIFGSPINRYFLRKKNFEKKNAIKLFKLISKLSKKFKIIFCIEPNSKIYNCNYINKIHEAKKIIQKINSKYLRINFDTGNFSLENDKIRDVKKLNNYIANFQISEKNLNSLENRKINHEKILSNLKIGKKIISLETSNLKLSKLKKNIYILKKIIKNIKSQC